MANKTPQELLRERNERINAAIRMEIPDRVPIDMSFGYFSAKYAGVPNGREGHWTRRPFARSQL
jgi:hypothetical protein